MEITIDDLLMLEPRLTRAGTGLSSDDPLGTTSASVSWVVSARLIPPHLPPLRGSEAVFVSSRVTAAVGAELPALLREAHFRRVGAVVFEYDDVNSITTYPMSDEMEILRWAGVMTPDMETEVNRLLTECRSNLYRIGSEFERQMAELTSNQSGMSALIQVVSQISGLPLRVTDAQNQQLAGANQASGEHFKPARGVTELSIERKLPAGLTLHLGPIPPDRLVIARFLVDRITAVVGGAARRDEAARPRGAQRAQAIGELLNVREGRVTDQRTAAIDLNLNPDSMFVVAATVGGSDAALARALAPLGLVHSAGEAKGRRFALVSVNASTESESLVSRIAEVKRKWNGTGNGRATATLALSTPVHGVAHLPGAAMEATFVSMLQTQAGFRLQAASFDSVDDIGAFRLLYQLRNSDDLGQFVLDALGTLELRDQRGILRATLRVFLETGGSQVEASTRLGIHRNTLTYRLRRIGEFIGRDVADPESWLTLHLALLASEMLDTCSHER